MIKPSTITLNRLRPWLLLGTVFLLSLGCRFSPEADPTAEPQGFLPLTEVANITPPPPPRQACPIEDTQPDSPTWAEPDQSARPLLDYLNAGGSPQAISPPSGQTLELARPDLDGDGLVDLAFVLAQQSQGQMRQGSLLVFRCLINQFELAYTVAATPELGAPEIISTQDINGSGGEDLLISQPRCGAHTCTAQVQFLTVTDGELSNRLEGATDDLPSPKINLRASEAGPDAIEITATGINSAGAGPFRPFSRLWAWDPNASLYRVEDESQADPQFRVHLLHDADRAASQGDFAEATQAYLRLISDDALQEWLQPEQERQILSAYARFRLLTTAVQVQDPDQASRRWRDIQDQIGAQSAGSAYRDLANAFWTTYEQTSSYQQACQSARAYAAAHRADIIDPLYFGYSNPTYTPESMCPLGE